MSQSIINFTDLRKTEQKVLELIATKKAVRRRELERKVNRSQRTIERILHFLRSNQLIKTIHSRKGDTRAYYSVVQDLRFLTCGTFIQPTDKTKTYPTSTSVKTGDSLAASRQLSQLKKLAGVHKNKLTDAANKNITIQEYYKKNTSEVLSSEAAKLPTDVTKLNEIAVGNRYLYFAEKKSKLLSEILKFSKINSSENSLAYLKVNLKYTIIKLNYSFKYLYSLLLKNSLLENYTILLSSILNARARSEISYNTLNSNKNFSCDLANFRTSNLFNFKQNQQQRELIMQTDTSVFSPSDFSSISVVPVRTSIRRTVLALPGHTLPVNKAKNRPTNITNSDSVLKCAPKTSPKGSEPSQEYVSKKSKRSKRSVPKKGSERRLSAQELVCQKVRQKLQAKANGTTAYTPEPLDPPLECIRERRQVKDFGQLYESLLCDYLQRLIISSVRISKIPSPRVSAIVKKAINIAKEKNVDHETFLKAQFYWFDKKFKRAPKLWEAVSFWCKTTPQQRVDEFLKIKQINSKSAEKIVACFHPAPKSTWEEIDKYNKKTLEQLKKVWNLSEEEVICAFYADDIFDSSWLKKNKIYLKLKTEGKLSDSC